MMTTFARIWQALFRRPIIIRPLPDRAMTIWPFAGRAVETVAMAAEYKLNFPTPDAQKAFLEQTLKDRSALLKTVDIYAAKLRSDVDILHDAADRLGDRR